METKHALKIADGSQRSQQKNIVDATGSNWIAMAVDAEQVAVLQLIVPQGKTTFPCPHLIADEQGKNWLLRPDSPQSSLGGKKYLPPGRLISGRGDDALSPPGKLIKNTGLRIANPPRKQGGGSVNSPGKIGVSALKAGKMLAPQLDMTAMRSPGANSKLKNPLLKPAGTPPAAALVGRGGSPRKPPFTEVRAAAPPSAFAPKLEPGKASSSSRPERAAPAPAGAATSASETYLVKPVWARLKAKASNRADPPEQDGLEDIEILAEPAPAWKVWLRRMLPAASVVLLALGSWQLAVGY